MSSLFNFSEVVVGPACLANLSLELFQACSMLSCNIFKTQRLLKNYDVACYHILFMPDYIVFYTFFNELANTRARGLLWTKTM